MVPWLTCSYFLLGLFSLRIKGANLWWGCPAQARSWTDGPENGAFRPPTVSPLAFIIFWTLMLLTWPSRMFSPPSCPWAPSFLPFLPYFSIFYKCLDLLLPQDVLVLLPFSRHFPRPQLRFSPYMLFSSSLPHSSPYQVFRTEWLRPWHLLPSRPCWSLFISFMNPV